MDIKTIVFDLDGTLLSYNGYHILPETQKAVEKAKKLGIDIVLASGRDTSQMLDIAKEVQAHYIIALNGSVIFDRQSQTNTQMYYLDNDLVLEIKQYAIKNNLSALFTKDRDKAILKSSPHYEKMLKYFGKTMFSCDDKNLKNLNKILLVSSNANDDTIKIMEDLKDKFPPERCEINRSSHRTIDINPPSISKGQALATLALKTGLKAENTAVFGDAGNDIEMFKWAKYSFAMENAVDELKVVATEVIGDNESNAIAKKIEEIIKYKEGKL